MVIVFLASLRFFYSFGLSNIFNVLQPDLAASFQLSSIMMGLTSSLFFYAEVALIIPAGLMLDRMSSRTLTTFALLLCAVGVFLSAYAHSILWLVLARVIMGVGAGFQFGGCVRVAINWLREDRLARGMGMIVTIGMLGGIATQIPFSYLISVLGWREALIVVGILGCVIAAVGYIFIPDHPRDFKKTKIKQIGNSLATIERFKLAFLNKQNIFAGLYVSLINLPLAMLGAMWGIFYLGSENKMSVLQASAICSMIFVGVMVGSPLAGMISDRLGKRREPMMWGAFLSFALVLMIILHPTEHFSLLMILYFLLALVTGAQMISYPLVIESNSKEISNSATSVISIISMLGGAVSQSLFGYIVDIRGYKAAIWILPLAFIVAFGVSYAIKETRCRAMV